MLPAELIDHIFSFLRGNISALKACSEAHPFCSRLAERHLYADIVIKERYRWAISELYKLLSNNSHILDHPRTMEIWIPNPPPEAMSIISMMPRMTNLISLKIWEHPCSIDLYEDFLSTFRKFLQQSAIEELLLYFFDDIPLSVLENGKNIKKLTLDNCIARHEPMSSSGSCDPALETLVIGGKHNTDVLSWSMRRVTRLTSLEVDDYEWDAIPALLTACSKSLTRLDLNIEYHFRSTCFCATDHQVGHWIIDDLEFPFTLSALMCLKELSISGQNFSGGTTENETQCALPAMVRLAKTAPWIQSLVLNFFSKIPDVTSLGRLDWSPLSSLQTDFAGTYPRIELQFGGGPIGGRLFSPKSVLDALAGNEVLMGLVQRDVVILKPNSERYDAMIKEEEEEEEEEEDTLPVTNFTPVM